MAEVSIPARTSKLLATTLGVSTMALLAAIPASAATPNLEGVWKIVSPTTSLKPIDGPVPLTAEGRKVLEENKKLRAQKKFDDYDITQSRCSNPGVPRLALTPMRFKIWHRLNVMTFDYEWNRALRQINFGAPVQADYAGLDLVPTMTGKSNGHWEGDTLVAETRDISDRTLLDEILPHSPDLKVTERFQLVDADTLVDRITVDDPAYYSRPWTAVVTYKRQPQSFFPEHVCLQERDEKSAVAKKGRK